MPSYRVKRLRWNVRLSHIAAFLVRRKRQTSKINGGSSRIFCVARGLANTIFIEEIGGGLNLKRAKFVALMDRVELREVSHIILAHKNRLVRFGFQWFERFCIEHGTQLLILNNEQLSPEQEMVQDLLTIVHCFSARLYGLRNYKKVLREALAKQVKS
jgi:predicted site-specific integrase-resolvase